MTQAQALRHERRAMAARRERAERALTVFLGLILAIALMSLAECGGPSDAELDAAEVQMWQERGVTVQRW